MRLREFILKSLRLNKNILQTYLLLTLLVTPLITQASAVSCTDSRAATVGTSGAKMNGFFVGSQGCFYDPLLYTADDITPIQPLSISNPENTSPIFVINGALANKEKVLILLAATADHKQRPVIGIYNAFVNPLNEIYKFVDINNPSATTFRDEAYRQISSGRRIALHGISQAGFIMSRSLLQLKIKIWLNHSSSKTLQNELMNLVDVEVLGGLSVYYPDGPRYVHYVNERDLQPYLGGVMTKNAHPGKGAVIATFNYANPDCNQNNGAKLWEPYPGSNADLEPGKRGAGLSVHSICVYAATGFHYEALREFAPEQGYTIVPLTLGSGLDFDM